MRDIYHNITVAQVLAPAVTSTDVTSSAIDLQGYDSSVVLFNIGQSGDTLSGSVYWTLKLTECDTEGGSYTDVAASDIHGSASVVVDSPSEDEAAYKIGYVGSKRYLKAVASKTGTHTNGTPIGIAVIKGNPNYRPVA